MSRSASHKGGRPQTWLGGGGLDPKSLASLGVSQLRQLFQEVFGEATASNNAVWLRKKLCQPRLGVEGRMLSGRDPPVGERSSYSDGAALDGPCSSDQRQDEDAWPRVPSSFPTHPMEGLLPGAAWSGWLGGPYSVAADSVASALTLAHSQVGLGSMRAAARERAAQGRPPSVMFLPVVWHATHSSHSGANGGGRRPSSRVHR